MNIEKLNWDTEFFGYEIGKVTLKGFAIEQYEGFLEKATKSKMRLIYVFPLDRISVKTLLDCKIPLVDTKVTFEKADFISFKSVNNIKSYDSNEKFDSIQKLALLSGEYSRYRIDKKFSNNEYGRLYSEWIIRSINKEIASDVIIYKKGDLIKGFVSYKMINNIKIVVGLIAVDKTEHGQGIGKVLMQAVENIAFQQGIKKILVSTQFKNEQALRFYKSCGYKIIEQQEIFHLWIQ